MSQTIQFVKLVRFQMLNMQHFKCLASIDFVKIVRDMGSSNIFDGFLYFPYVWENFLVASDSRRFLAGRGLRPPCWLTPAAM